MNFQELRHRAPPAACSAPCGRAIGGDDLFIVSFGGVDGRDLHRSPNQVSHTTYYSKFLKKG